MLALPNQFALLFQTCVNSRSGCCMSVKGSPQVRLKTGAPIQAARDKTCLMCRLGVMDSAHVVIGACMLTSARSADFWLRLCGAAHMDDAEALSTAFAKAERGGAAALEQHCYAHGKSQIEQVPLWLYLR